MPTTTGRFHARLLLVAIIISLLALATNTAEAQLPPCEDPPFYPTFPTWYRNAQVSVIIDTDFSPAMRDAIRQGFRNWNYSNDMYANCSSVYSHEPTYENIPDAYSTDQVPSLTVVVRQRPEAAANVSTKTSAGSVIKALITVGACVSISDSMTGITAHEIGHTFGLANCDTCTALSSIMARAYGWPATVRQLQRQLHGATRPDRVRQRGCPQLLLCSRLLR